MIEYEVKFRIDGLRVDDIVRKLEAMGFRRVEERVEEDTYIDLSVCMGVPQDIVLRIRKARVGSSTIGELTYKGPRIYSEAKVREELSVEVDDPDTLKLILSKLGFKTLSIRKRRVRFVRGPESVFMDDVEGLGKFIEYEVMNASSIDEFRELLRAFTKSLGLRVEDSITKSYLELMLGGSNG